MSASHSASQSPNPRRLLPEQEDLLKKAFRDQTWRFEKMLFGYSGASICQMSVNDVPVIVKIAHPVTIQREFNNYNNYVWGQLRGNTPQTKEPIISNDGQWALLQYSYAGLRQSQTLLEYLRHKGSNGIVKILDDIFHKHGAQWYERAQAKRVKASEHYDRLLPEHLQLTALAAPVDHAIVLDATELDRETLAGIVPGQIVNLRGFKIEKERKGVLTLYAKHQGEATIRLKLWNFPDQVEGPLPDICAVVKATRHTLFDTYAQNSLDPTLGTFSSRSLHFASAGDEYHNPIAHLSTLLDAHYTMRISTIHGDLNLQNILIDEDNRTKAYLHCWLIDFATTGPGPVLLDLQWLEVQVITWMLSPLIQQSQQSDHVITTLLIALNQQVEFPHQLPTALGVPYQVIRAIRQIAADYLVDKNSWEEYYRGLTLVLMGALKFEELSSHAHRLALISAATTLQWAGIRLPKTPSKEAPDSAKFPMSSVRTTVASPPSTPSKRPPMPSTDSHQPTKTPKDLTLVDTPTQSRPSSSWLRYIWLALLSIVIGGAVVFASIKQWPTSVGLTLPVALPTATPPPELSAQWPPLNGTILAKVLQRGYLNCGVNGNLYGFSAEDTSSERFEQGFYANASGLDADYCRVVAVAVFGEQTNRVHFKNLSTDERLAAVIDGDVDVLFRNTTWTAVRDASGIDFGPVIFHDGQKIMVPNSWDCDDDLQCLQDKRICVLKGTTSATNLNTELVTKQITFTLVSIEGRGETANQAAYEKYKAKTDCEAFSSDASQLLALLAGFKRWGEDQLIPTQPFSYEPLAPVVAEGDSNWRDVVSYAIWATIYAEQAGIDQNCIKTIKEQKCDHIELRGTPRQGSDDHTLTPSDLVFLGLTGESDQCLGVALGFTYAERCQFTRKIIEALGNYEEIYIRNITYPAGTAIDIPRGPNNTLPFRLDDAPRLFAPPFGIPPTATP